MAKIIKANGEEIIVTPKNGKTFDFGEMKEVLGMRSRDLIEFVYGHIKTGVFVCDEEAKQKRMPRNDKASAIGYEIGAISFADCFAGDVLYFDEDDFDEFQID